MSGAGRGDGDPTGAARTAPLMGVLGRTWTIARSELVRGGDFFDRRTALFLAVTTAAILAMAPFLVDQGMDFDHGLYRIHIEDGSPLEPVVAAAPRFDRVRTDDPQQALRRGDLDIAVVGTEIFRTDTEKGAAAVKALEEAAEDYTFTQLQDEPDQEAAFPVRVEVVYVDRGTAGPAALVDGGGGGTGTGGDGGGTDGGTDDGTDGDGGDGVTGGGDDGTGTGDGTDGGTDPTAGGPFGAGFFFVPPTRTQDVPGALAPPFPFRSLLLAYFFLIPMNFVVQVYAGRIMSERLKRRGEPLLASPARPREIIAGRTLPYLGMLLVTDAAITIWLGGGLLTFLAVVPLVLAFLAFEFVAAMFARSFRELTFLTVFISVVLTIYAFLPAVFAEVTPVAFISPITLVVMDLRGNAVTLAQVLYATLPLTLVAGVLFHLGSALYREEDMFHQKPVPQKMLDALARQVKGRLSGFKLSILLMPFVFAGELLIVTFLFAWPLPVGMVGGLMGVALVEELSKGLPAYAGVSRGRLSKAAAPLFGALAGLGFFLAEKGFLLASLVGLFDVEAGATVFSSAGVPGGVAGLDPLIVGGLLLAPLALHVGTASLTGLGARHGRDGFLVALAAAVSIHAVYNALVIALVGGALGGGGVGL